MRAADRFVTGLVRGASAESALPLRQIALLATCNRVELYLVPEEGGEEAVRAAVYSEVFGSASRGAAFVEPYELGGVEALRHVCRVAAGIDSMVVGEHEIAGQVARAFRDSVSLEDGADALSAVARVAKMACRRVRSETALRRRSASVSSVAMDLAREELGGLEGCDVLLVGAGKVGRLVARVLERSRASSVTVANRSEERARTLADRMGASYETLDELPRLLAHSDLVITATGAPRPVLDESTVRAALAVRNGRAPLLIIDLAVPRDVDAAAGALEGVQVLTLDHVKARLERHISLRLQEVGPADGVVDAVLEEFVRDGSGREVEAFIEDLRREAEELRSREVDHWVGTRNGDGPPSREDLDRLTRGIVSKLLHEPMLRLRGATEANGRGTALVRTARELFDVESDPERDIESLPH